MKAPEGYVFYDEADLRFTGWEHECITIDRSSNMYFVPIARYNELKKIDNNDEKKEIISLLYTIYSAGFSHGSNEGAFPKHGTFEAFNRLIVGESPMQDNVSYAIKEKIDKLLKHGN